MIGSSAFNLVWFDKKRWKFNCGAYEIKKQVALVWIRPFKIKEDGVFLSLISFLVLEIFMFL